MQANLQRITSIAEEVTSTYGLHVVDVKLGQQGRRRTLEVTIYRPGGKISLNDCEQVSRTLEEKLDHETPPPIDGSFLLEVQSPGIDRKLSTEREFAIFTGQPVEVKTKQKIEGLGSDFTGKLLGTSAGNLLIGQPEKAGAGTSAKKRKPSKGALQAAAEAPENLAVPMTNLISVRLHPDFSTAGETVELNEDDGSADIDN